MCRRSHVWPVVVVALILSGSVGAPYIDAASGAPQAEAVLSELESPRGIGVILGDRNARLAIELARKSELLLYIQLADDGDVESARRAADVAGLLNRRIYVERGAASHIHLANNLADILVVCDEAEGRSPEEEILRVLRPGGKGLLGTKVLTKPVPQGIDQWSHPYHRPDNNPQSTDQVARAPYLTQFLAEPWYCPMPEVTVASGGRVFKAFGSRAFKRPQWPMLNTLIALNGYNGAMLWKRPLDPDFMIHRNTMIATPDTLYLADAVSCKLLDAATGKLKDEIRVPEGISDGPVWKWMALERGTLYALVGEQEPPGDALKGPDFRGAGWPWWQINKYAWGFGRTILAIDPSTKKILWRHRENDPLDTRTMCMKADRIYFHSPGKSLGCLDATSGQVVWRTQDAEILGAIGNQRPAQTATFGFATTAFAKCSDEALYFAGPQQTSLLAVSTGDGKLLWQYPKEGNFQLVLRDKVLYAMGSNHPSRILDPRTGEMLLQLPNRVACTRATGSADRLFVRGMGTACWDVAGSRWLSISPMRPDCHDGVIIAAGHLYWGPWMCGCNLSLIGINCLGPAGDFDYTAKATEAERLESVAEDPTKVAELPQTEDDWPTYRKDNQRSTLSNQIVASDIVMQWEYTPETPNTSTAPVTVGDLVFTAGSDGLVRALDAESGALKWSAHTGGSIRVPPSIAEGRAMVGSADGWIYAYEAASGRLLWRFRAAPVERKVPIYGTLSSTWPVNTGVLVQDGIAFAAAGIANYDGTHVYGLDLATGRIRWQNNTSGMTEGGQGAGVSAQGDLLLHGGKLYLAGGNRVPLASYNVSDGAFQPIRSATFGADRKGPRGHALFLRSDGSVAVSGWLPLYSRPEDAHYIDQAELTSLVGTVAVLTQGLGLLPPGLPEKEMPRPVWAGRPFQENVAVAVAGNAVVVTGTDRRLSESEALPEAETHGITALDLKSGKPLWTHSLSAAPVGWGLAIGRGGRVITALRDGRILCFGPRG